MFGNNKIAKLFHIKYPIIQGGMIWNSGWKLASAVSNAGGLGLIGAGSMYPQVLEEHLIKCKDATSKPFGVNLPLLYPNINEHIELILKHKVKIVFTSAGNPNSYTSLLKENGITIAHVVSSRKFALKAEQAKVDAIVAEGFEAGGHNGREETTTFTLIPHVKKAIQLPLIAAGGIGCGKGMLAAMVLGADGIQMGSRFVASEESSAHINFKNKVINSKEGDTKLTLKELAPVRLMQNEFYNQLASLYKRGASVESLKELLGRGRAKKGMFEGDLVEGELEIGQVSSQFEKILPVQEIIDSIIEEYKMTQNRILNSN